MATNQIEKEELSNLMALRNSVPLDKKLILSVKEACAYSGIAYDTMYEIISHSDCPFVIQKKKKFFIIREKLEKYVSELTEL